MKATTLAIPEVLLFEPKVFGDDRGFFFESFNHALFEEAIGRTAKFVQDNHSKRSEEHTSELQSLMRISYAVFCLKKNTINAKPNIIIIDNIHTSIIRQQREHN